MSTPAWDGCTTVVDRDGDRWLLWWPYKEYYCPDYSELAGTVPAEEVEDRFGPCWPLADEQGRTVLTLAQARAIAGDLQASVDAICDVVAVWDEAARDWAGRPAPQGGAA